MPPPQRYMPGRPIEDHSSDEEVLTMTHRSARIQREAVRDVEYELGGLYKKVDKLRDRIDDLKNERHELKNDACLDEEDYQILAKKYKREKNAKRREKSAKKMLLEQHNRQKKRAEANKTEAEGLRKQLEESQRQLAISNEKLARAGLGHLKVSEAGMTAEQVQSHKRKRNEVFPELFENVRADSEGKGKTKGEVIKDPGVTFRAELAARPNKQKQDDVSEAQQRSDAVVTGDAARRRGRRAGVRVRARKEKTAPAMVEEDVVAEDFAV